MRFPEHLLKLIQRLRKLPGVGAKTAERFAFDLLRWRPHDLQDLATLLALFHDNLGACPECGALKTKDELLCSVCSQPHRDAATLCVVASPRDVFSIEATGEFRGRYFVIGSLLCPLDGKEPDRARMALLLKRAASGQLKELICALDSTLEGDATALFMKEELKAYKIPVYRLALGMPMGSSIDFLDEGTLGRALAGRSIV